MNENLIIREMKENDWDSVKGIYIQGLEKGTASSVSQCPSYEDWDYSHHKQCRFV